MPFRPGVKCFLFAWIPAWGIGVFAASAFLAALGLSPAIDGCGVRCTFDVADAVSPQAKLAFGVLLGLAMWLARMPRPSSIATLACRDATAGVLATVAVLVLLPESWSRGFGIGLFGTRFALLPTAIYLVSAAIGAVVGTFLERSCRKQLIEP